MSNLLLKKSGFVHIPKCAGTFVQGSLYHLELVEKRYEHPHSGHLFPHQMQKEKKFYFTFVRHPYTWWPSYWKYSGMDVSNPDFDNWVEEVGAMWLGCYSLMVKRYLGEDSNFETDVKVQAVGKIENLFVDLEKILKKAGEDFCKERFLNIKNGNVPEIDYNKQNYTRQISKRSKDIIYKTERYVFDKFKYSK